MRKFSGAKALFQQRSKSIFVKLISHVISIQCLLNASTSFAYDTSRESQKEYWINRTVKFVTAKEQERLKSPINERKNIAHRTKNLIFFLGDGMGLPIITASRIYKNQRENSKDDQEPMSFEKFPYSGLAKTYCLDRHVTDSAASATAFLCGVKANYETVGVGPEVKTNDCLGALEHPVQSVANDAMAAGKWSGIVTNTRLTHATPAGLYAHSPNRNWESDRNMLDQNANEFSRKNCKDIAGQLLDYYLANSGFKVALGGGKRSFLGQKSNETNPNNNNNNNNHKNGERLNGENLIEEFLKNTNGAFVDNRNDLLNIDLTKIDKLLGLFNESHLPYTMESQSYNDTVTPKLSEMTKIAIEMLERSENGYFLLVEGGRIDYALHFNQAKIAMGETIAFQDAIELARNLTNPSETLIVVTADHSHVMNIVGYPQRSQSILDHTIDPENNIDGKPLSILAFVNGPAGTYHTNATHTRSRRNFSEFTKAELESTNFQQQTFIPYKYETHGGEDVPIYASGPGAHLFTGLMDNTDIATYMRYAMCVGSVGERLCQKFPLNQATRSKSPKWRKHSNIQWPLLIIILILLIIVVILSLSLVYIILTHRKKQQSSAYISNARVMDVPGIRMTRFE